MNIQIIYIAIYRVLECLEEEYPSEGLSSYLDMANPYVFNDRKSADPVYYDSFKKWAEQSGVTVTEGNSFEIARKYIAEKTEFAEVFSAIDEEEWAALIALIKEEEPDLWLKSGIKSTS